MFSNGFLVAETSLCNKDIKLDCCKTIVIKIIRSNLVSRNMLFYQEERKRVIKNERKKRLYFFV